MEFRLLKENEIELELTETSVSKDLEEIFLLINNFEEIGVNFSLDDLISLFLISTYLPVSVYAHVYCPE